MADFPTGHGARQQLRNARRAEAIARAVVEIDALGRSIVCRDDPYQPPRHTDCVAGAGGCLCPCHDPAEEVSRV